MENKTNEIIKKLDSSVLSVIGNQALQGFDKAHAVSYAIGELQSLLTDEYMKPIMALQGNRLGFRTDKDRNRDGTPGPGYPMSVVKNCLIEAVLMGLQPTGNQFNIIAGNTYPTKEGCGYLLAKFTGLKYDLVCGLPHVNTDRTSASVEATISWAINNGEQQKKVVPIPIKIDQYTSVDSIIGKATRKARAWLLSTLTGVEVSDGEVEDVRHTLVSSGPIVIDAEDLQFQFINKKDLLSEQDQIAIERILKNKEVKSYPKVKQILESK